MTSAPLSHRPAWSPEESARIIQRRTHGRWTVWYGQCTHRFYALPPRDHIQVLVEAGTPDELVDAIAAADRGPR